MENLETYELEDEFDEEEFKDEVNDNYVIYKWELKADTDKAIQCFIDMYKDTFEVIKEEDGSYYAIKCFERDEYNWNEYKKIQEEREQFLSTLNQNYVSLIESSYKFEALGEALRYESEEDYSEEVYTSDTFSYQKCNSVDNGIGYCHGVINRYASNYVEAENLGGIRLSGEYFEGETYEDNWENEQYSEDLLNAALVYYQRQQTIKSKTKTLSQK